MVDYESVPVTELRDRLGKVVQAVAQSGRPVVVTQNGEDAVALVPAALLHSEALPPAYFDQALREKTVDELNEKINQRPAEEIADAREWLRKVKAATPPASAAGAA
ncbi:type II toxin-antitoxin system Phd/YefM family antitoxin [Nocardia sp. CA-120079]|uniref:type II toxin-antitoxin system Phd/YefM family antitoxin n=1 Tax=Nocardia sp. CA-120079 TaxID=3239974 RepID=UPI003D97DDC5